MMRAVEKMGNIYEVKSVLGKDIRTTKHYWSFIESVKHPELKGQLDKVLLAFKEASEVRKDEAQEDIYIYYYKINRHWICSVARHLDGDGFLVTAYLTSKSKKKGKTVWQKK